MKCSVFAAECKVTAEFRAIYQKLCENFAFPKRFHTKKLGEITVYHAVNDSVFTKKLWNTTNKLMLQNLLWYIITAKSVRVYFTMKL